MVPSSPQSLTPQGVELTIDNLVDGGDIYIVEGWLGDPTFPAYNYAIPSDVNRNTILHWVPEESLWRSDVEDEYHYTVRRTGESTINFSLEQNGGQDAAIVAQVVDGVVNWVNAESSPRINYNILPEGFEEQSYMGEIVNASRELNVSLQNTVANLVSFVLAYGSNDILSPSAYTVTCDEGINASLVVSGDRLILRLDESTFDSENSMIYVKYGDIDVLNVDLWAP